MDEFTDPPLLAEDGRLLDALPARPLGDTSTRGNPGRAIRHNVQGSLIVQILNMVSGIELARGLGLGPRGELAAALLWPRVVGTIAELGLEEAMTYYVARERENAGRLIGSSLVLCFIQGILFTAITAGVVPVALSRHGGVTVTAGLIFAGYTFVNVFGAALGGALNGLHRYGSYNVARLVIGAAIVGGQSILLVTHSLTVIGVAAIYMGCYGAWLGLFFVLVRRAYPGPLSADRRTMRRILVYGVKSHTSSTSSFLNQRLDQLVISAFLSARQLGIYVVATTLTLFTPLIGASIAVAALPNIAALRGEADQVLYARRFVSFTLVSSIVLTIPIIAFAPLWLKLFFGSAYTVGANVTRVTAVASIAFATTRSLEAVLRALNRPLAAGIAEIVALGATIVALAVMLPAFGLVGAAWASLIAYSISGAWMATRIRATAGVPIRQLFLPDREGLASAIARLRRRASRSA